MPYSAGNIAKQTSRQTNKQVRSSSSFVKSRHARGTHSLKRTRHTSTNTRARAHTHTHANTHAVSHKRAPHTCTHADIWARRAHTPMHTACTEHRDTRMHVRTRADDCASITCSSFVSEDFVISNLDDVLEAQKRKERCNAQHTTCST